MFGQNYDIIKNQKFTIFIILKQKNMIFRIFFYICVNYLFYESAFQKKTVQ